MGAKSAGAGNQKKPSVYPLGQMYCVLNYVTCDSWGPLGSSLTGIPNRSQHDLGFKAVDRLEVEAGLDHCPVRHPHHIGLGTTRDDQI